MRDKCIDAVVAAAGRQLTQEEIKGIEDRIKRHQRQLASEDQNKYLSMTTEQRVMAAAQRAADEIIAEAEKKRVRVALTIKAHDRINNYLADQKSKYGFGTLEGIDRLLAFKADGKSDSISIETHAHAIANDYIRRMVDGFESLGPRAFGLFSNKEGLKALTYELFGQDSSKITTPEISKIAKLAAKQWMDVSDNIRSQFNSLGGDIGKIENWRMPQNHSQPRIVKAGAAKWIQDVLPMLDRKKYMNEDGSAMSDQQLIDFLTEAWTTLATGGANKIEPGKIAGKGMRANYHSESRSIHFKDAESYLSYSEKYGGLDGYTTMMRHILSLSHDIAMVEILGPNPDHQFKYWMELAKKEESLQTPDKIGKIDARIQNLQGIYDYLSGKNNPIVNRKIAEGFDSLRSWLVATRLGSAFITSVTDNATLHLTAKINNLSSMKLIRNQLKTMNLKDKEELRIARRAGLSLQTMIGQINRWGADSLGASFSSKMSGLTIRLSGLNAASEARRRAYGVTMYGSIGSVVKKHPDLASIDKIDRKILESKGVTETVFKVWKQAKQENWYGDTMLTPESIYQIPDNVLVGVGSGESPAQLRRDAALKLMGIVLEEINMAVIEPGVRERVFTSGRYEKGTIGGEIARSFWLFKSFPVAMITRHFTRGISQGTASSKALYIAALVAGTTLLGAVAQQISDLISGRDPKDMTKGRFWAMALAKGGSLGIYGDFLFNTNTQYGNTYLGALGGPVLGYIEDLLSLSHGNIMRAAKGEKTHTGAEAIKFIKGNIPLQNLWYTKAVTDRLIFNQLQEMASPGYMARVEARARRDFQQSYWWPMKETSPRRAPDFESAIGR